MPSEYLEEITKADIAFRAWGRTVEEIFAAAADAVTNAMVDDLNSVRPLDERRVALENNRLEMLLFDFMQELIFYKDADLLLLRPTEIAIADSGRSFSLRALLKGEPIDPARHALQVDVKAVTMHCYSLIQTADGWECLVVLDV